MLSSLVVSISKMARDAADREPPVEAFWKQDRGRLPVTGSYVVDVLAVAVAVIVLFTIVGLIVLWPPGHLARPGNFGPIRTVGAVAERVHSEPCKLSASHQCKVARVKITDAPQKGQLTQLTTVAAVGSLARPLMTRRSDYATSTDAPFARIPPP